MAIIRIKNRKNFIIISKACLQDNRISAKAKGIHSYLLSLPDNWKINTEELISHFYEGKSAILSGLKELIRFGYCKHIIKRNKNGKITERDYIIYEISYLEQENLDQNLLDQENLNQENLDQVNQPLLNNNINKERKIINNYSLKKNKRKKSARKFHPESIGGKLAQLFLDEIEKNDPEFETPNLGLWETIFSKMIFVENKKEEDIKNIILYCQQNDFWYPIVINPFVLNAKYSTLKMQMLKWLKVKIKKDNQEDVFEAAKRGRKNERSRL